MWTIIKVFIEFVTILLLFYVLVFWLPGRQDFSSPTSDRTCTPCSGSVEWTSKEVPGALFSYDHLTADLSLVWSYKH